jgi:dephospho-CoA kinase
VKPGAAVIDVGMNTVTDSAIAQHLFPDGHPRLARFRERGSILVGDVHPEVAAVAGALTPVPGGVGPLTITMLMMNTLRAAQAIVSRQSAVGRRQRPVRRIALTGGIATGKSYVRSRFEALGVPTIDSDVLARAAVAPGSEGLKAVVTRFGPGVLDAQGALDRARLARIVFGDRAARRDLEAIIHPDVRHATERWFASLDAACHPLAIADIPLLYEVGREGDFDAVIVAATDPETQLRRVMKRNNLSEEEARQRIAAQLPIDTKVRRADYVIRTEGTFEETDRQVREVFERLSAS